MNGKYKMIPYYKHKVNQFEILKDKINKNNDVKVIL